MFLAEGAQAVREVVATDSERVVDLFTSEGARRQHAAIVTGAEQAGIPVHTGDDEALASLSETVTPQGIVAVCRSLTGDGVTVLPAQPGLVAVLVEVQDPGNAGTVVRCADAAGADAVLFTSDSVDPQGGKAVRSSAGSVFHLPIGTGLAMDDVVRLLHERGVRVLAADGSGNVDLDEAGEAGLLTGPTAWLFGNEARGLPESVRANVDHVVRIPIHGRAESLNLATAAAVCLYASASAQRGRGGRAGGV